MRRKTIHTIVTVRITTCVLVFFLTAFVIAGCRQKNRVVSLDQIRKTGHITLITRNDAHSYYLYRDQAMGFEFELASAFADSLGLELKVQLVDTWDDLLSVLDQNPGAFAAANLAITPTRRQQAAFSNGYMTTRQRLIVNRANTNVFWAEDLTGKTVHIRKGSTYHERLEKLRQDGIYFTLKAHDDLPTEELIRRVAVDEIGITVADSHVAKLNRRYYPQVFIAGPINVEQQLGWATHPNAPELLAEINEFLLVAKNNGQFAEIYHRYYAHVDTFDYTDLSAFHRRIRKRLPRYDRLIKKAARKYDFDWRLIAAIIYQESHFNRRARSSAGAFGLMQLTKKTARSLGVNDIYNPAENIFAGVRHLRRLYNYFDDVAESDRLLISMAAYNVGQGHVRDAQKLAQRKNLDPSRWGSIRQTLPLLRFKKYYRDAVYGYCRGMEPVQYCQQILIYYDILKRQSLQFQTGKLINRKDA